MCISVVYLIFNGNSQVFAKFQTSNFICFLVKILYSASLGKVGCAVSKFTIFWWQNFCKNYQTAAQFSVYLVDMYGVECIESVLLDSAWISCMLWQLELHSYLFEYCANWQCLICLHCICWRHPGWNRNRVWGWRWTSWKRRHLNYSHRTRRCIRNLNELVNQFLFVLQLLICIWCFSIICHIALC